LNRKKTVGNLKRKVFKFWEESFYWLALTDPGKK